MNRAIDPSAADEPAVGGIDDGVDGQCRDVGNDDIERRRTDRYRRERDRIRHDLDLSCSAAEPVPRMQSIVLSDWAKKLAAARGANSAARPSLLWR
jgi:hypothetical protein